MKSTHSITKWMRHTVAVVGGLLIVASARAETELENFDNFFLWDSQYGSWGLGLIPPLDTNNWTISRAGFGGGYATFKDSNFVSIVKDASGDDLVELLVTIASTNIPPDDVTAGHLVLLEDGDGTLWRWQWYGLKAGSHVLTGDLTTPDVVSNVGTNAGLDLANLTGFHVQVDPGGDPDVYTTTLENLRTLQSPPPACDALVSDFDNVGLLGGYGSWSTLPPPTPGDWTFSQTNFGGGFQNITPNIDASSETTVELSITVSDVPGPPVSTVVVLQDGDGTQETWTWGGLTNGSYVLTGSLANGTPVPAQPGTVPGFDASVVDWFHLQIAVDTNAPTYTVAFENLRFFGFDPTISAVAFDPATSQADLTWESRPDRSYSVWQQSEITGAFSLVASNIVSGGTSTSTSVISTSGDQGYFQISEECQ
jgi:hypothetical protein